MTDQYPHSEPVATRLARGLATLPPRLRWRASRLWTGTVLRRAFGSIGAGTVVVSPRIVRGVERIHLGARCAVYEGAWLECEPGHGGTITVGDDNYFGHLLHLHAVDDIVIGDGCTFADGVLVNTGRHVPGSTNLVEPAGPVVIGDRVFVGEGVSILGGVTIGDEAVVGAGSVVTRDVPAGAVVAGAPARGLHEDRP